LSSKIPPEKRAEKAGVLPAFFAFPEPTGKIKESVAHHGLSRETILPSRKDILAPL